MAHRPARALPPRAGAARTPESEQHGVVTDLLRSVWAVDLPFEHSFRPLSAMADEWVVRGLRPGSLPNGATRRGTNPRRTGAVRGAVAHRSV